MSEQQPNSNDEPIPSVSELPDHGPVENSPSASIHAVPQGERIVVHHPEARTATPPMQGAPRSAALKRRTRIKICGITSVEMALAAAEAGADAIGLVFVPSSPRYVLPGPAQRIAKALPPLISSIGVFLNPSDPDLQNWRGQWVQMHGQEEEWQLTRVGQNRRIIKGLKFDPEQVRRWERCPHVSALLIDGVDPASASRFNHERLAEIIHALSTPVILAGGLNPDNVEHAIKVVKPFGVDVSSGVESSRGVKEVSLIREFCAAVREADASLH
jgi:phosphoribosylanthranilate isomerase